ncbi:MAG TPA: hypothetical protein VMS84_07495 [Mycobacterium sp.]|nr:hypothetical protein [Mycobacterium sp.]
MPFLLPYQFNPGDVYSNAHVNAVAAAINALVNGMQTAFVAASESTTSTTYTDLTTVTDTVTVTIGQSGIALVFMSGLLVGSVAGNAPFMSFAASGANTIAAATGPNSIFYQAAGAGYSGQYGAMAPLTGLNPGATTFKLKYASLGAAGTASFQYRRITVIPFP